MSSVSFVVAARNDDHGGKMLTRMRVFMESLLTLANKYHLKGELIIVEWNPPEEKPRLWETLKVSVQSSHFTVRYIEVPTLVHSRFRHADAIPLFQMIAKNVGIRRARGEFVISTAIDLLFSEELISFLSYGSLDTSVLYRINRYDVRDEIPLDITIEEKLKWCREKGNIIRVHTKNRSIVLNKEFVHSDNSWRDFITARIRPLVRNISEILIGVPRAHTNACGDFTMMARECWEELRGHPEIPIWSMHIDSFLCYMAVTMGLRQVILKDPMQIFHMEHATSWVSLSLEEKLSTYVKRPWLDYELIREIRRHMLRTKKPLIVNEKDWGLASENLQEHVFGNEECQ